MLPVRPIAYRRRQAEAQAGNTGSGPSPPHARLSEDREKAPLQHLFCERFEAELEDVVRQLRASWLAGPALLWDEIYPLRQHAQFDAESRLANTLTNGFLQFSQLLAGFEILTAEQREVGAVTEQRIASLEQLLVHARYRFRDLGDGAPPS